MFRKLISADAIYAGGLMQSGDVVTVQEKPELGKGRVIRFYANQGTVLVEFEKPRKLTYCDYKSLIIDEEG